MRVASKTELVQVGFTLNGKPVTGHAEPRMLLSDFLRQVIGATGTHVGCEHGVCGCCTLRIDGVAQRSCLVLAVQAEGLDVQTVEGISDREGAMSVLQEAFRKHHALQCGFCTPGILMSFVDFMERVPDPTEEQLRDTLSGHICRCTGYAGIMAAVIEAAETLRVARGSTDA